MAIDFEKIQNEFKDIEIISLCIECEGLCENSEIVTFLPGELEFIANKLNLSSQKLIAKYCNIIKYKNNEIYMLKAGICPFLENYKCELEKFNCKLVRCLLYPTSIGISKENKIDIFLDFKGCPMAHRIPEEFKDKSFKIYEEIKNDIPLWWLEFTLEYDEAIYDYSKLKQLRDKQFIELTELEECIVKRNPR